MVIAMTTAVVITSIQKTSQIPLLKTQQMAIAKYSEDLIICEIHHQDAHDVTVGSGNYSLA